MIDIEKSSLYQLLGTEGIQDLRNKVIDMLVEEIREQLRESSYYITSPDDVSSEIFEAVVEEVSEEIKAEYKAKIAEEVKKKIDGII